MKRLSRSLVALLETHLKTDITYLFNGVGWLTAGQIVAVLSTLSLGVFFGHVLPKETYGMYKYLLSLSNLSGVFLLSGLGVGITRAAARLKDGTLAVGFRSVLRSGIVLTTALFAGALYYWIHNNSTLAIGLIIIGICNPLFQAGLLYDSYLIGKKDFRVSTLFAFCSTATWTIVAISTGLATHSPVALVTGYFLVTTLSTLGFYWYVSRYRVHNNDVDIEALSYGKHMSAVNIVALFADSLDSLLLFHYLGAERLAVYAFAIAIPEQMKGIFKNIGQLSLVKFSEGNPERARQSVMRKMLILLSIVTVAVGFYIILAPFLFAILFPKYVESVIYSQIAALAIIPVALVLPYSFLQAQADTRSVYAITVGSAFVRILFLWLLIPIYGILGALMATVASRLFSVCITIFFALKPIKNT